MFVQKWYSDLDLTSNTNFYKLIKQTFEQTRHLYKLPHHLCKALISFRTRNHRLPIEVGRWRGIPANDRKCPYCNDIGDEFHYILKCSKFKHQRCKYIRKYFFTHPNIIKLSELFNSEVYNDIENLAIFCKIIMNHFKQK